MLKSFWRMQCSWYTAADEAKRAYGRGLFSVDGGEWSKRDKKRPGRRFALLRRDFSAGQRYGWTAAAADGGEKRPSTGDLSTTLLVLMGGDWLRSQCSWHGMSRWRRCSRDQSMHALVV